MLRKAKPASEALLQVCARALSVEVKTASAARNFFLSHFSPFEVLQTATNQPQSAFFTGYYEPVIAGSLYPTREFRAPIYGLPDDLVRFAPDMPPPGLDPELRGAKRLDDGTLIPFPTRHQIETREVDIKAKKLIFLRDRVETFFVHIQGSARVKLSDGCTLRLVYAGRSGQPYTSIGRLLIEHGEIGLEEMSLARLKRWLRSHGQNPGEAGFELMAQNGSYIFFSLETDFSLAQGPKGGEGIPLTPFWSIAIDRSVWPYGLPFFICADLPWDEAAQKSQRNLLQEPSPFQRLMVAQDTGSAILGPGRADIFFGSGHEAGQQAGNIRHFGRFFALAPQEDARGLESQPA